MSGAEIIVSVVSHTVVGVGGVITALLKGRRSVRDAIKLVADAVEALRLKRIDDRKALEQYKSAVRLELDSIKDDHDEKVKDLLHRLEVIGASTSRTRELVTRFDSRQQLDELRRQVSELDALVERVRDQQAYFVKLETFQHFTQEQQEQWLEMQRNLGQIEGILKKL